MNESNGHPVRILIVEDEPDLCEAMVSYLNLEGYLADGVGSASAADAWLKTHDVDIVVLDIGLPDGDGISWLNQLPVLQDKGIVMATARHEATDRLRGLKAGADAYLVKPIDLEELRAIVHNVTKRIGRTKPMSPRNWRLDVLTWSLTSPDGKGVRLTQSEQALLAALAAQPGRTVPRDALILAVGHDPATYDPRRMEILVRRLRNKVRMQTSVPLPLETARGLGYAFVSDITLERPQRSDSQAAVRNELLNELLEP